MLTHVDQHSSVLLDIVLLFFSLLSNHTTSYTIFINKMEYRKLHGMLQGLRLSLLLDTANLHHLIHL